MITRSMTCFRCRTKSSTRLSRRWVEPALERAYTAHMLARLIPLGRLAFVIGGSAFIGYAFWDLLLDSQAWARTGPIRLAVVAFFALGFAVTYARGFRARPGPWLVLIFATYNVVALGFALVLAQLEVASSPAWRASFSA